ncbi:MAG: aminopeptidase P family protein [Candidatus Thermoplasmatota archaeon]|nr:aminopeptidase P family protein [Candidatus Thermoplasmatota archaeon]
MATREKNIFAELRGEHIDAVVLTNASEPNVDLSFFYATGIVNGIFERCFAIIRPRGVEVISSDLEALSAEQAGLKTTVFRTGKDREGLLRRKLRGCSRIGVNANEVTHANYKFIKMCAGGSRLVDVSNAISKARMIKDREEVALISRACRIVSRAAETIPDVVEEDMKETEAAAELNYMMMKLGASGPAFATNASFGSTTAEPHYVPSSRRLKRGQLALFDFGASYRRYVSDLTRTFVCGRPDRRQREMYETVLEAQLAAIDEIRAGVHGRDVDHAAREVVDSSKFKGKFIHSTGHGLGLSVHDPGAISPNVDMVLREGMVLTVEPGIYVKGFGGVRIEDDVLITRTGCRILTSAPKEFLTI